MRARRLALLVGVAMLVSTVALAAPGSLEGKVLNQDRSGVGGVTVVVQELGEATLTDNNGAFAFRGIPAGTYSVVFTLGDDTITELDVAVSDGATTALEMTVDWEIGFAETITVYSASRRIERIVDAPSAVTVVSEKQIEQQASHGQVPKLLEFTPGAEVTQSGIYDYNLNTRGFNSSLNRRVATLIDGRDPSVPFLGAQEWASISFPLDDLASMELVRGPSAALYGANASSGVLNMTTREPRYSEGGMVRFIGGELATTNADFRWAGGLGNDWYMKVNGGYRDHDDFSVSRNVTTEYPGLPMEAVPLAGDGDKIWFGGVRLDRYFRNGGLITVEGGMADIEGPLFQTGIGRVQLLDVERPWARVNYSLDHWNFMGYWNKREAPQQLALSSGANLALESENVSFEVQTNWDWLDGDLRLVAGASYSEDDIDSFDPMTGRQSLMFAPVTADYSALFGQLDWQASKRTKIVAAARYDESDLHSSRFSPKLSVVYGLAENHTLRFTYNEAFQVANYSEFFLQAPVAAPINLAAIEAGACAPFMVDCGFGTPTPLLALGNTTLDVEEVTTYEVGYSAILDASTFVTADYYYSQNENFITDLLPQLGTSLGQINPNFGPYVPPADHPMPAVLLGALNSALPPTLRPFLSNNLDDAPIFAVRSYTNFGEVDTQGVDLSVNHYFDEGWKVSLNYSWFDFDIKSDAPDVQDLLIPNAPEHSVRAGLSYDGRRIDWLLSGRWVDDFRWVVGPFNGPVESYTTVDLAGNYKMTDNWIFGINVSNMFDNVHYEAFGGDLLARRALASVTFQWE